MTVEVVAHRTRGGRLDFVTLEREPGGVVRLLGFYPSRPAAQRALDDVRVPRPVALVVRAVGAVLRVSRSAPGSPPGR